MRPTRKTSRSTGPNTPPPGPGPPAWAVATYGPSSGAVTARATTRTTAVMTDCHAIRTAPGRRSRAPGRPRWRRRAAARRGSRRHLLTERPALRDVVLVRTDDPVAPADVGHAHEDEGDGDRHEQHICHGVRCTSASGRCRRSRRLLDAPNGNLHADLSRTLIAS